MSSSSSSKVEKKWLVEALKDDNVSLLTCERLGEGIGFLSELFKCVCSTASNGQVTVVVKLPVNTDDDPERAKLAKSWGIVDTEVSFYAHCAASVRRECSRHFAVPKCLYTCKSDGVIVLEMCSGSVPSIGDGLNRVSAVQIVDGLASLHGAFWTSGERDHEVARHLFVKDQKALLATCFDESIDALVDEHVQRGRHAVDEATLRVARALARDERQLDAVVASAIGSRYDGPKTLVHGDLWTGNVLIDGDNRVTLLDWQFAAYTNPMVDVALLLQTSCANEVDSDALLARYVHSLGRDDFGLDDARQLCERSAPYIWLICYASISAWLPSTDERANDRIAERISRTLQSLAANRFVVKLSKQL
jgi:thiamine kinase-like enzyme